MRIEHIVFTKNWIWKTTYKKSILILKNLSNFYYAKIFYNRSEMQTFLSTLLKLYWEHHMFLYSVKLEQNPMRNKRNCFYPVRNTCKNLAITIPKKIWEIYEQRYAVTINYFISKIEQIFHISLLSLLLALTIFPSFHLCH